MSAAAFLNQAFSEAAKKHHVIHEKWIGISIRVGGRLPASLLMANIQRYGRLDLLLREIEGQAHASLSQDDMFTAEYLSMFSEMWVGGIYEIFRLLRQRKLADDSDLFVQILKSLELLRIPLEKHEIAKDQKLSEPLVLQRHPPNDNASDSYEYSPLDNTRAHIMPSAISSITGSMMWHALDLQTKAAYWIERRWLSDKTLELWST
jgi:hypothetical protein